MNIFPFSLRWTASLILVESRPHSYSGALDGADANSLERLSR